MQKHTSIFGFVTIQCYMRYLTQEQLQVRLSENRISSLLLRNKLATVCKCENYIISFPYIPFYCTSSFTSNSCWQMLSEDLQYNHTSFQSKYGRSIPNSTLFPKELGSVADDQHCKKTAIVCLNADGAMGNLKGTSAIRLQFQLGRKLKQ